MQREKWIAHGLKRGASGTTTPVGEWRSAPSGASAESPELLHDDVHVWRASIDLPAERFQQLARTLSEDERVRSEGFRFEDDRRRFVVGRGVLRNILGLYLAREPREVRFRYGPHGKPALFDATEGVAGLNFNVSHAGQYALLAFTRDCQVGVDIERIRPLYGLEEIIERHFTPHEKVVLRALSGRRKLEVFFAGWTGKEAYLKATGRGLTWPLESIDTGLHALGPERSLALAASPRPCHFETWLLRAADPAPGYAGALAVARRASVVSYWVWR